LAACTNLASMFTARATDRLRELAVRLAIGAGRGRVVRQVLTETLLLSLVGGGAGYVLAAFLARALSRWRAPMDFPVQFDVEPDWRVFLFALASAIIAGALFGSAPAWRVSRIDPNAVPLSIDQPHTGVFPADKTDLQPSDRIGVAFYQVSPGFFATMGTKLLAGREFTWHDDTKSPQVAIVNLAFARRILHNPDAV